MGDSFGAAFGRLIKRKRAEHRLSQAQLACALYPNLDAEEAEKRKGDISKLETGKVANPAATTIKRLADALQITDAEIDALQQRAQMPMAEQLDHIAALTRDELELLASRFEIEKPHTLSEAKLQELLTQKAEEYRAYRDQIDNLDDRISAVHNLKAAAQDAAAKLDFDEVENILARVDMVETEIMAESKEARATNALLRGRVDQAYAIFVVAADSFRELDLVEWAERRNSYFTKLYKHGLRYGGEGVPRAIDLMRPVTQDLKTTPHKILWAMTTHNLAIALANQGTRTEGAVGIALLAEAVTAFRDTFSVHTKNNHPVHWGTTTQNLAGALQTQGKRTEGTAGTALLAEAVTAFRDALTIRTTVDEPVRWAMTTQNLALALQNQGTRTDGAAGTALLAEAVTAYRDALTIRTKADHPVNWAMTTQNLAGALGTLGIRTESAAGTALLAEAVTAYRDALTVTTKIDHPVDWAETIKNLALAHEAIADHEATADPRPDLETALGYVDAALTVFDKEHTSYEYASATEIRSRILAKLASLPKSHK